MMTMVAVADDQYHRLLKVGRESNYGLFKGL